MIDVQHYKAIFDKHGGMMRTKDLNAEKIYYHNIQQMIVSGHIEKVRYGYYQWIDHEDFSETGTVIRLFPDAILCMDTALRYYGYNHKFDKGAFENEFKERLWEWYKVRDSRVFQQKVLDGPGYLQEPRLFHTIRKAALPLQL